MTRNPRIRQKEKNIMLSMIQGQHADALRAKQGDHYALFEKLHNDWYESKSSRTRATFERHYNAILKEHKQKRQCGGMQEEQASELEAHHWQDQGHVIAWPEEMGASPRSSTTFLQSDDIPDDGNSHDDTINILSNDESVVGGESMPDIPAPYSSQMQGAAGLSSMATSSQAGTFQSAMPFTSTPSSIVEPQTMPADWSLAKPVSSIPQCSNTPCDRLTQNSQIQQVTDAQTLHVPVILSVTYGVPVLPGAIVAQYPQERAHTVFPSSSQHQAMQGPGIDDTTPQQNTIGQPFVSGYHPQNGSMGVVAPQMRTLCTCSATAANQMNPMTAGQFTNGSPTTATMRNWFPFSNFLHGAPTQMTDMFGNSPCGSMYGSGWPRG